MFLGVSTLNLDAKGRLAIPAKHRERLAEHCASRLVVTVNPKEHCLWLYPEPEWKEVARKVVALPGLKRPNQVIKRLLLGHALELEMDGQGRVLLSNELRTYAELDKRVALVGQGEKFEIWDEERWITNRESWVDQVANPDMELTEELENLDL